VPESPAATAGAAIAGSSTSPGRAGLIIGLVLTGLAAATAIGYVIGTRSTTTPAGETAKAVEPAPAEAAATTTPAAIEQPVQKPASAAPAKLASQPSPAAAPATASDPEQQQWARMRAELAACGKANLVCHEKVRWRYCKHMWGKVPDCPQTSANVPTN
jgi:cell division septation protein DedD